jgi:hypothetical protein
MENEVKEIVKVSKTKKSLPVELTVKGKKNLVKLQGEYQVKHNRKISLKSLGSKIFETATLNF